MIDWAALLQIVASLAGIVATWYIGKAVTRWLQKYRDGRNRSEVTERRRDAQSENQRANRESDRLRDIDGR